MALATFRRFLPLILFISLSSLTLAQSPTSPDETSAIYQALKDSSPFERSAFLENVRLERDRVSITFESGEIYFPAPVRGKIRSAVFVGSGTLKAVPPPVPFEKDNLRRMIHQEEVNTNFKAAVLRFTDNTADELLDKRARTGNISAGPLVEMALSLGPRLLKETGANISSRQLESILNREDPGLFFIQVEGGKLGRFSYIFDPQARIPACNFGIDAGEKGLVFTYDPTIFSNDVWMAFHEQEAFTKGFSPYADVFNLLDTPHYKMTLDLQEPHKVLGLTAELDVVSRINDLRVISFMLGEGLDTYEDERRKKQLLVSSIQLADGTPVKFFQESWETGFTVVLPQAISAGQKFSLKMVMRGDFMKESQYVSGTYFPRSTETWYPRHGVLNRSSFDVLMIHRKKDRVVSVGELVSDAAMPDNANAYRSEFRLSHPVSFITFAVGPYEIHKDVAKQENGKELPLEFYSMPGTSLAIKEDFILAEMSNSVRYFSRLFGAYPYPLFRGVYHPFSFGQGFPTTIMIPAVDSSGPGTFSFIAHETSHQWWGDVVYWRSYRDQWLSEGFAEYSGMLYAQFRDKTSSEKDLIRGDREALKRPARNLTGVSSERLTDIGPLVLGRRLETRETGGAYTALVYNKGGLVLRMLHFLFTDPSTGSGQQFFDFMTDFVNRYRDNTASTEDFFNVANEHVVNTALAKKFGYKDLRWFYRQWVMQTYLPSYELTYRIENDPAGGVLLKGEIVTKGLPEDQNWFMPLPLVLRFANGTMARGTVAAQSSHTPLTLKLPQAPQKIELDPDMWVLSAKTSISKN